MDTDALISEICRRVMEKAAALEAQEQDTAKPKILILTEKHGEICHETLENQILTGKYQTECALLKGYDCKAEDYEASWYIPCLTWPLANWQQGSLTVPLPGSWGKPFSRERKYWQPEKG